MEFIGDEIIYLNKDKLLDYLSAYYTILYKREIIVKEEHYKETYVKVGLKLFYYDKDKNQEIILTDDEVKNALTEYANCLDYQLIKFQYVGFVRHVGYFTEEDSAIFDGVKLYLKNKSKKLTKKT